MIRRIGRRKLIGGSATAASLLVLPGRAPAAGGAKPLSGVNLNVSCWSAAYPKYLADYIPEFEETTGAKVTYETPSFPVYNQRMDVELSTGSSNYDVINVTFIYSGRWIGAGWVTPLDDFIKDPKKTPADWGSDDFLEGAAGQLRDKQGRLCGVPWIVDIFMSGTTHNEIVQKLGGMPDTLDGLEAILKKAGKMRDMAGFIAENHYGWTFISFLMSYGGMVFRNPPDDLTPVLDTPEAIAAADFYGNLLRNHGPDGVLSYVYDQVVQMLKQGKALYSTNNQMFLVQMAGKDSKVAETCGFSMFPAGPKGQYPQVATHGWGIPAGSKQKDAAWEFIKWAMSKQMTQRMFEEKHYSSVARRSVIEGPDFKKALTLNGFDVGKMYVDTIELASKGYMKYRTVPVYPQVDREIDAAIQAIVSQQKSAKEAMQTAQANSLEQLKRAGVKL